MVFPERGFNVARGTSCLLLSGSDGLAPLHFQVMVLLSPSLWALAYSCPRRYGTSFEGKALCLMYLTLRWFPPRSSQVLLLFCQYLYFLVLFISSSSPGTLYHPVICTLGRRHDSHSTHDCTTGGGSAA